MEYQVVQLISLPDDDIINIIMHAYTYIATHYKELMWTTVESVCKLYTDIPTIFFPDKCLPKLADDKLKKTVVLSVHTYDGISRTRKEPPERLKAVDMSCVGRNNKVIDEDLIFPCKPR